MFQIDYKESRKAVPVDAGPSGRAGNTGPAVTHRALLSWAEHCIECAAPSCYSSCDLYSPTDKGKCRRFENGIVARPTGSSVAAEMQFREWGKLESQGNALLLPAKRAARLERWLYRILPWMDRVGGVLSRFSERDRPGGSRWLHTSEALHKKVSNWLLRRQAGSMRPNRVEIDIDNVGERPTIVILTAYVDRLRMTRVARPDQLPHPSSFRIELPPGRTRQLFDAKGLWPVLESQLPFNLSLAPADGDRPHLVIHRAELVRVEEPQSDAADIPVKTPPISTKAAKIVVFDLDNTLWDGVLLEGDVRLRPAVRDLFQKLDERGILLSIASKNAADDARAKLEALGLDGYFLFPQVGWLPKSQSVAAIVKALNIGIDSVIFVDDNPFERAEVSEVWPAVEVLADSAIETLAGHPRLQGAVTAESRSRRQMYKEAAARDQAEEKFGDDYTSFLQSCAIVVAMREPISEDFDRIAELVQRTNQLNFSGRNYGRSEIIAILEERDANFIVVSCTDRFGDYGKVGFCIWTTERAGADFTLVLQDFMLSCRVQGKFIEQALLYRLLTLAGPEVTAIRIEFRQTDRNRAAQLVLEKLGFMQSADGSYARNVPQDRFAVAFLTIDLEEA